MSIPGILGQGRFVTPTPNIDGGYSVNCIMRTSAKGAGKGRGLQKSVSCSYHELVFPFNKMLITNVSSAKTSILQHEISVP